MLKTTGICCVLSFLLNLASQANARTVLPEGIYLKAVDGHVVRDANSGLWQFEVQDDPQVSGTSSGEVGVKHNPATFAKGTRLILLPNDHLQSLIEDLNRHPDVTHRLWSRVTAYKGKNYLWILNYLQLTQTPDADVTHAEGESETRTSTEASGDRLEIPASVRKTLARQRGVRSSARDGSQNLATHQVLLNRVGYVGSGDSNKMFIFDGFSLTAHEPAVRLLPSRALEQMEREQTHSPGPHRFNIAGITSTFEGKTYLLVQRAYRVYSHGNFGM